MIKVHWMNISRGWDTNLKLFCDPPLKTFKLSLKNIKESMRMWMSTQPTNDWQ